MSLARGVAAAVAAIAALVLLWSAREPPVAQIAAARIGPSAATGAAAGPTAAITAGHAGALAAAPPASPSLPAGPPFRDQDLAMTAEGPDAPDVVLRSSQLTGNTLAIALATRQPLADGVRRFATISVADGLGNTIIDCTWRDVELRGDAAPDLHCELPDGVALPLAISGHERPAPTFIESPTVVAIDQRAH